MCRSMQVANLNLSRENAGPILLAAAKVSSGYFDVFQVRPISRPRVHRCRGPARPRNTKPS